VGRQVTNKSAPNNRQQLVNVIVTQSKQQANMTLAIPPIHSNGNEKNRVDDRAKQAQANKPTAMSGSSSDLTSIASNFSSLFGPNFSLSSGPTQSKQTSNNESVGAQVSNTKTNKIQSYNESNASHAILL